MALADPRFAAFAAVILLAFATEAATGFGAAVVALTLAVHFLPIERILPVFVPLGLVLSAVLVWRQRAQIDRVLLLRTILPFMGAGLLVGIAVFEHASGAGLRRALGVFVVAVAAEGLWRLRGAGGGTGAPAGVVLPPAARAAAIALAGVIHGVFVSGGPLLAWALGRSDLDKGSFRATLSSVWLVLGAVLLASYAWRGLLVTETLRASAALLPVLIVALALGEWMHRRLDEIRFRRVVYALLVAAGVSNLV